MMRDKMLGSKDVRDLKAAQWEGFRRLASKLPNHQVLAVELVRTFHDETAAILTITRDGQPVRYVVRGDARGRVKPPHECRPRHVAMAMESESALSATEARSEDAPQQLVASDDDESPNFAFGRPPVEQPPTPGLLAFAAAQLATAFDAGEFIDVSE